MKKIILKKIKLENFRGIKSLEVNFNDDETTINGANATGKSTIFNAYCWLLFGKDAQDRKDFNIRPIIDGKLLRRVDCEVSATLIIDGSEVSLRRIFKEKWVKPRGEAIEVYKGNETETFWNDVPINITEYQKRIDGIVDNSIFKIISMPNFFPNMDWKLQREQLFQIAGTVTDDEIASTKPEYKALLDKISGKSLADFKLELSAKRRKLRDELEQIQPRIDQTHKLMPASTDFSAIESEIETLEKKIVEIENAINDKTSAMQMKSEQAQSKQREIHDRKQLQSKIVFEAQTASDNAVNEANKQRRDYENKINLLNTDIAQLNRTIKSYKSELEITASRLQQKEEEVIRMRSEWNEINAKTYSGNDTCHYCNQRLPQDMLEDAEQKFFKDKQDPLTSIREAGQRINVQIEKMNNDIAESKETIRAHENALNEKQREIEDIKNELNKIPVAEGKKITGEEIPEFVKLSSEIGELEVELSNMKLDNPTDVADLRAEKISVMNNINTLKNKLYDRVLIEKYTTEIDNLELHGKQIAQQIADVERDEYTIQNFTKSKIEESEKRINGMFRMVTFQLFDYTIDRNEIEVCIPLVNGIPYGSANNAGQVNAGLDIIATLTKFHGVSAPIFIDNRESVNSLIQTENQIINLVVTNDKALTIN